MSDSGLERELRAGAEATLDTARDYHESTKLTREKNQRLVTRVGAILGDPALHKSFTRAWKTYASAERLPLPRATPTGRLAEEILARPRPALVRGTPPTVTLDALATILRCSYGPTGAKPLRGHPGELQYFRATASGGGLYPLELYVVAHDVLGLAPGVHHYDVHAHELELLAPGDARAEVAAALLEGAPTGDATILVGAVLPRTLSKYQFRGYRFALYDTGALLGSLTALAAAAGLGVEVIDDYLDDELAALIGADAVDEQVVAVVALGAPAAGTLMEECS